MPESKIPHERSDAEEREIDYLICRQCNSPCYIFEMVEGHLAEAMCVVCGNEEILLFNIGEEDELL